MKVLSNKLVATLLLFSLHGAVHAGVLKDHPGYWYGDLKVPNGPTLKTGIEIFTRADGSAWASYVRPGGEVYNLPVTTIHETDNSVELIFNGTTETFQWVDDHFKGEWRQNGGVFPVELRKVAQFPKTVRPQTPKQPFPYREETLAIAGSDGVMLGATLTVPKGRKHPTLAILVHGSGPQTRDEESDGHRPFEVLADYLARQGVAVLRYDKRGISRSTGDYENHTLPQLEGDVSAVVIAMQARHQFQHIGLIGHSEGSQITAAVASKYPELIDYAVSLAGTGLPGLDVMLLQDRAYAKDQGASATEVDQLMIYVRHYYEIVIAQSEPEARLMALKNLYSGLPAADTALIEKYKMNVGTLSYGWVEKPFVRAELMADPQNDWRKVRCPVLALNGDLDHQVPTQNLQGIVKAMQEGDNKNIESAILPSLNHMFQTAKTGSEDEYASLPETFAPIALERVAAFVRKQK